jgi:hypothetical protein
MKPITLLLFILLFAVCSYAQSWNGTTPGNIYYNSGNVGIGTTSPIVKLDVSGGTGDATTYDPILSLSRISSTGNNEVFKLRLVEDAAEPTSWGNLSILRKSTASSAENDSYYTSSLYINGRNGNIGIGTTSPSQALDVTGNMKLSGGIFYSEAPSGFVFRNAGGSWKPINSQGLNIGDWNTNPDYGDILVGTYDFDVLRDDGSSMLKILNNGNVGIGTTSPSNKLEIYKLNSSTSDHSTANLRLTSDYGSATTSGFGGALSFYDRTPGNILVESAAIETQQQLSDNASNLIFYTNPGGGNNARAYAEKMRITYNGNVGIGTTNPEAKLTVKGKIEASEIQVKDIGTIPDYVFKPDYKLMSLEQVKRYVNRNYHLPEVPSEKEFKEKGMNMAEMNALLLKKIEELTLYAIDQNKHITDQNKQLQEQGKKIEILEHLMINSKHQ